MLGDGLLLVRERLLLQGNRLLLTGPLFAQQVPDLLEDSRLVLFGHRFPRSGSEIGAVLLQPAFPYPDAGLAFLTRSVGPVAFALTGLDLQRLGRDRPDLRLLVAQGLDEAAEIGRASCRERV